MRPSRPWIGRTNDRLRFPRSPKALASYFETDFPLPFQTTPAFFTPDVLQKYKADPEKFTLEHRSIQSRGGWYLKSYDVNEVGQVHAYLCDLAMLPYKEQLYWQSFNEWPKGSISRRAFETDFEGKFTTIEDPLLELKYEIEKLDHAPPDWWRLPRGKRTGCSDALPNHSVARRMGKLATRIRSADCRRLSVQRAKGPTPEQVSSVSERMGLSSLIGRVSDAD